MQIKEFSTEIGEKPLVAKFTDLADQTNGSVILTYGDTVVLATAVMSGHAKEGMNYFPLTVDYEEKFYAAGQILGSRFMRRESRPSEDATLTGRVIDRTLRPLFEQHIRNEIQVIVTVLSIGEDDPDVLAINAASLALATSDIPWNGPASAVRIGKNGNDNLIVNPTYEMRTEELQNLELLACGKDGDINMIEAGAKEADDELMSKALKKASEEIEKLQEFQKKIVKEIGKEKIVIEKEELSKEAVELFEKEIQPKMEKAVFSGAGKAGIYALEDEWKELYAEKFPEEPLAVARNFFDEEVDSIIHKEAIDNNRRPDDRKMDEIRDLYTQAGGLSKIVHGVGVFYRGGTHVLSVLTLGGPEDSQLIDSIEEKEHKRFMHHYNFPPFSTGETGRIGVNRRMIGHGALAEKALSYTLPSKEEFPYTIRIVSESMASNGSTSMASTCASTLALMDAGVPISAPVAGMAMGLMLSRTEGGAKSASGGLKSTYKYKILTDIQGPEDEHGDMDLKIAGTRKGITAIQMDVKVNGVPIEILVEALGQAAKARTEVLDKIEEVIPAPRAELAKSAPRIITIQIKPEQIGSVIGSGGKIIKQIKEDTGAEIDIEDDGLVYITGKDGTAEKARDIIESLTHEYKAGERFEGEVVRILDFGAFVNIAPSTDGLVHVSEIAQFRVEDVKKYLKEGDKVPVVVKEVDDKGRINLSIKQADPDFIKEK